MPGHEPISVAGLVEKSGSERRRTDADKLPSEVHHPWIERQLTNDEHGEKVPGPRFRSVKIRDGEHLQGLAYFRRRENTADD